MNVAEQGRSGLQPLVLSGAREVGRPPAGLLEPPAPVGGFLAASLQGGSLPGRCPLGSSSPGTAEAVTTL